MVETAVRRLLLAPLDMRQKRVVVVVKVKVALLKKFISCRRWLALRMVVVKVGVVIAMMGEMFEPSLSLPLPPSLVLGDLHDSIVTAVA